jgi:hypothetical protein
MSQDPRTEVMLERLREQVPAEFVALYGEEVAAGEPEIALETLLDEIIENDVRITRGLADDLQRLAKELSITRKSVAYLDKLVDL